MEWYVGCGIDDLVVPKDQEFSDRLPLSPEILSKWGLMLLKRLSLNKYFGMDTNSIDEDFNFNSFYNVVGIEASIQDKGHSSGSSTRAGSSEESLQRTALLSNWPDYQLDQFAGIEQLDDIFLYKNSLLEDLPRTEVLHNSIGFDSDCIGFDPESQYVLTANKIMADISLNSKSNSRDAHTRRCSKYLKTHDFSPSVGWEHEEVVASPFISCYSEAQAPMAKLQVPSEQNFANELVGEETSLEESVLQELKIVMTQMTDKTRIWFCDALYRLAVNSKIHVATLRLNGHGTAEASPRLGHYTNMRSGKRKALESRTNVLTEPLRTSCTIRWT